MSKQFEYIFDFAEMFVLKAPILIKKKNLNSVIYAGIVLDTFPILYIVYTHTECRDQRIFISDRRVSPSLRCP